MLKVLFFASYREQLDCSELDIPVTDKPVTLSALRQQLSRKGNDWRSIMEDARTLVAVNQSIVCTDAMLNSGDEVAFFPPVTGG